MASLTYRGLRGLVAITTFTAVAAMWGGAGPVQQAQASAALKWHPPKVQKVKVLPRKLLRVSRHAQVRPIAEGRRPDSAWPARGTAEIDFGEKFASAGVSAASRVSVSGLGVLRRAGHLPVFAAPSGRGLAGVGVDVLGRAPAARLGAAGVVFTVSASGTGSGRAAVGVDYASFANAGGADWAERVHLVQLPPCALTTPQRARCQVQTPVRSVNHFASSVVSATLRLSGPRLMVLAAVSGASGSNGDFTATSLSPSGSWSAGGSSGDFTWSYPITVPPAAAGSAPSVSLDYDSGAVDGRVASTNNQFGMVGEGFSMSTDSYIERTYTDCADDPEGAISGDFDNCWAGQAVTMNLDGRATQLVLDDTHNTWHEADDAGDQVQYLTGTAANTGNGTYDNGYWVVTAPNGTQYYFGKNKGPGWAAGDPQTDSAFTEPVYGPHSGDPCFSASGFSSSVCTQAWRWNLDFVVDPNGNAAAYYYTPETNYYGADNSTTGVQYDRGGYLSQIDYGLRDESGSIYGTVNPPDETVFNADQRCIPTSTFACNASQFTSANAANWPDTPQDQQCLSGATCNNHAPTFWSQLRIDQITTQYYNGTKYVPVDSYALGQGFPTAGDPELMLNSITRTGFTASGSSIALPSVNLSYQLMDNRIPGYNGEPAMSHWRLSTIETETGETILVSYSTGCTVADIPADPSTNNTLCYPVLWTPVGDTSPILDYFNKYVVTSVDLSDGTGGDPAQLTSYTYVGNPAWHYDDDPTVKAKYRTYGQFRGYAQVEAMVGNTHNTTNGAADVQTLVENRFFRGMNGDPQPGGGVSSGVTVSDSNSATYPDDDALAGQVLETQTFNGVGGAEISASITVPTVVATTASQARTGLPALTANMVRTTKETDYTDLASGTPLVKTTVTTYDSDGRAVLVDQSGTSIQEICTQTSYDDNTSAWIRNSVSEVIIAQQACPAMGVGLTAADIIGDTRTYYDGATSLTAAPTAGNPTKISNATANSAGSLTFVTQKAMTYDSSGRALTTTDGDGNVTTRTYTPPDGGPLSSTSTTNVASSTQTLTSTQTFDPGRGSLLNSTDAAGYVTSATYDALGRLTAVWKPGRAQGTATANTTYSYQVLQSQPLAVTTNTLVDYSTGTNYVTSTSIYDSLGELRQTQTAAEGGDTVVTDNFYDSHGWVWQTNNKYVVAGSPSTSIVSVAESAVNDRTINSFDGSGRIADSQDYNGLTLTDAVQTVFGGNQVTNIKTGPAGSVIGTPQATVTDVLGEQTQTIQYASAPTVTGSVITGGSPQTTMMSYNAAGNETQIKDPAGNTWNYTYDLLGRQTKAVDPDTGTTVTGYDAAGNVSFITDGNGTSDNFTYDGLNRKIAEFTGSTTQGAGTKIATWVWDTLKKGLLSFRTSIVSGGTYEDGLLGYDSYGTPTGTWVLVPTGQPLAGTYRTTTTYSSTGLLLDEVPAAGGGLPVDSIALTYDQFGNAITEKGNNVYASGATWTPYNEISQINLGTGPSTAALTYGYNAQTRNITGINLSDQQPSPQVDNIAYTYNPDQQVTQIADTQGASGSPVEDQCLRYDSLSRLNQVWTSSNACATNPTTAGSNATVSGPEPYWQTWTFDSLGDIATQVNHAPAGNTSGDTTDTYHYVATGHAHAVSSISATNTVSGPQPTVSYTYNANGTTKTLGSQSLTWNANDKLASAGTTATPTGYIYDADSNLLVQNDTSGTTTTTTLYLPGEQLTTNGSTTSGVRYYSFAGVTIGETTPSTLYWLDGSTQGTMTTAVSAASEATVIRRAATPYGNALTGSGSWPDNHTFLGDPFDSATGLVSVGARFYNPLTDLFISADPGLDTSSPQTMSSYTYAADSPVTNSDPTGLECIPGEPVADCNDPKTGNSGSTGGSTGGTGGDSSGGAGGYTGGTGDGYSDGSGGSGGSTGGYYVTSECMRFGLDCSFHHLPAVHNPPGGMGSFFAGLGFSLVSTIDVLTCMLCVAAHLVFGTPDLSSEYLKQVKALGVDTNSNSTFTGGFWAGNVLLMAAGGLVDGPGAVAGAAAGGADDAANTADAAANAAMAAGKTRGAASELHLPTGGSPYVDISGSARTLNPDMVDALDSVPPEIRPGWHGWCSEIGCMNQALNDGNSLAGSTMRTVAIGDSAPGHLLPKAACPSCSWVMGRFGVIGGS